MVPSAQRRGGKREGLGFSLALPTMTDRVSAHGSGMRVRTRFRVRNKSEEKIAGSDCGRGQGPAAALSDTRRRPTAAVFIMWSSPSFSSVPSPAKLIDRRS